MTGSRELIQVDQLPGSGHGADSPRVGGLQGDAVHYKPSQQVADGSDTDPDLLGDRTPS
jgi:hypothetical protein